MAINLLTFTPAIAAVAGNVTLVGASFACAKEATRLVRQKDDWVNSFTGGALVGSACATACGSVAAASALATDEAVVALEELEARGDGAEDACTAACREVLAHCL